MSRRTWMLWLAMLLSAQVSMCGIMDIKNWSPSNGGHVGALPEMKAIDTPFGPGVQVRVLEANPYQGLEFVLEEPVDLNQIGTLTFKIRQNAVSKLPTHGCIHLDYTPDHRQGLMPPFLITPGKNGWSSVILPIDVRSMPPLDRVATPSLDKVVGGSISLYSMLKEPGQVMAIADMKFNPKQEGDHPLPVIYYYYTSKRTSGDTTGAILTDGKIDEANQAFYEQYSEEPEIVFDLNGIFLVNKISLSAVAIPNQNFYEFQIVTSRDGKEWKPAATVKNTNDSGKKQAYTVTGENLGIVGRYFKIRPGRSRTDFHISLAEIAFEGKVPTDAELEQAAAKTYDMGPAMSADEKDYWKVNSGSSSLLISRKNGVGVAYTQNGAKVAERLFGTYELTDGHKAVIGNDYDAVVTGGTPVDNGFQVTYHLPKLKDIQFKRTYSFVEGLLAMKLEFVSTRTDRKILYTATNVVLPQDFRNGGVYETWGAGHDMQHKFAGEVTYDYPADSGPVVVFESPKTGYSLLHFRYKHDDRYIQIGSGTVTVAGVGDKRTAFTATGWRIGDGIYQLTEQGAGGSNESRLVVAKGDVTHTFDRYLALPEVKAFRSQIHRPSWVKNVRYQVSQGWVGMWGDSTARIAKYYTSLLREGDVILGLTDNDFRWGDFPTEGEIMNQFGGVLTPEGVIARQENAKAASHIPLRIFQYTWLWSANASSNTYKEHPEWFITKNANGERISFFPGWGLNYYRQLADPAARQYVVDTITAFVNRFKCDMWYLDGGGSPVSVNWPKMQVDAPDAWDSVYLQIRKNIQKQNPEAGIFFNHPENPLGDFGYLENSGGVLTSNWRDGATWMYKFKLWQRPDPIFCPLYIYWTRGVDAALRQYIVGTGLNMTECREVGDPRRNVPYMSAQQQTRWARLVSAGLAPNWRYEPGEQLEGMPLTFGPDGWVFMKNHDKAPITRKVQVDLAPLGLTDAQAPVYHWEYSLKDFSQVTGLQCESDREAEYALSKWQSDFIIEPAFLEKKPYAPRAEHSFTIASDRLKLWYVTQSPALVWSVDNMRVQLPLSKTLNVEVAGRETADGMELMAVSGRRCAELAAVLPKGKKVASVTVNGKVVEFSTMVLKGTLMARFAIPEGESHIQMVFAEATAADAMCTVSVVSAVPGKRMGLNINGMTDSVIAQITRGGDLVWSRQLTSDSGAAMVFIDVPKTVSGGEYGVAVYDLTGKKLADAKFRQLGGQPTVGVLREVADQPVANSKKAYHKSMPDRGLTIHGQAEMHTSTCGNIIFMPDQAAQEVRMLPMPASQYSDMFSAYEMTLKRYIQVRLTTNWGYMGKEGPFSNSRNYTQRYGDPETLGALAFDFQGTDGYKVRSYAGLGVLNQPINNKAPLGWGAACAPQNLYSISSIVTGVDGKDEEVLWLDLYSLGAPDDWTGKVWFGLHFVHPNGNRWLKAEILQSTDTPPKDAKVLEPYILKGGRKATEKPQTFSLPQAGAVITIDGKLDEAAWKKALVFNSFSMLGNPTVKAPDSSIRMMRDDKNVYVGICFTETRPEGFLGTKDGLCWYNDGAELYFQKRGGKNQMLHFIFDVTGNWYAHDHTNFTVAGAPEVSLPKPNYAMIKTKTTWTMELAIPISQFGTGAPLTGFNFGRNRLHGAQTQPFSVIPGNDFRNFNARLIKW